MTSAMSFGNWLRKVCPWIRKNTTPLIDNSLTDLERLFLLEIKKGEVDRCEDLFYYKVGRLSAYIIPGFSSVDIFSEEGYLGELPQRYGRMVIGVLNTKSRQEQNERVKKLLEEDK